MTGAVEKDAASMKPGDGGFRADPEFVAGAVGAVRKLKPDYGHMLGLYEKIFIEQERAKSAPGPAEFAIPREELNVLRREMFPLVRASRFIVDAEAAGKLFTSVCAVLLEGGEGIAETAEAMLEAAKSGALDIKKTLLDFVRAPGQVFDSLHSEMALNREVAQFILFNSVKPFLAGFSRALSSYLDAEGEWEKGYCPVCGSMPELSVLSENGKRSMLCGYCSHKWFSKRVFCPFCENDDHGTLKYFEIEGEEEYRVDVCEKCGSYIKTVDTRKLSRPVYLPLESAATPYIDVKFQEMGYRPGSAASDN